MWGIWMIGPPLPLHSLPLSLPSVTCWGGGEDGAGPAAWIRPLQRISDSEEEDPLTYGAVPPELKAQRGCVRWLMSGREGGFSSRSWAPPDRRYVQSGWMMRIKVFFFHNLGHFQAHFPDCCGGGHRLPGPSTEHLNFPPSHFLSGSSHTATWLQRSYTIWFKLDPEACAYFLLLSPIPP